MKKIVFFNTTLVVFLLYVVVFQKGILVDLRTISTSSFINEEKEFNNSKDIVNDSEETIKLYRNKIKEIPYLKGLGLDTISNEIELAQEIVKAFSKNGSENMKSIFIMDKLTEINKGKGHGYCSDYSQSFIAISNAFNLKSREVHSAVHTFCEFYSRKLKKWIWIDPQFALMATNNNKYLSIIEIKEYYDDNGNFKYEAPLFWLYFPECRKVLADYVAFNPWNNRPQMSWTDIFDMRMFSSYIIKDSNVHDRRIQDYLAGTDRLKEAENKAQEIFNLEHDAWQE